MKGNKTIVIGAAILIAALMISTATAVQITNKEAVENILDANEEMENILDLPTNNIEPTGLDDVDVKSLLLTLYNNQDFLNVFDQLKNDIITEINNTFSGDKKTILLDYFNLDETFDTGSLYSRIQSINYGTNPLTILTQDIMEVADNESELKNLYEGKARNLLDLLYQGDGQADPDSAGLHDVVDAVARKIASVYTTLMQILEPILGAVGKLTAVIVYTTVILVLLFPVIIPCIIGEAAVDALIHEPTLIAALENLYQTRGIDGLIAFGWFIVLEYMIRDKYLQQATLEFGRILVLKDYSKKSDGSYEYQTAESEPEVRTQPKAKGKHPGENYEYIYAFDVDIEDNDMVGTQLRDKVQAGWDWDNDNIVDEWTDLSYERKFEYNHTFPESGYYTIKYIPRDQWGTFGEWTGEREFLADHPPEKPSIEGKTKEERNVAVTFTATTTDPEQDKIYYQWEVDGTVVNIGGETWFGPYNSGESDSITKTQGFSSGGEHTIKVKAKDNHDVVGSTETFTITIDKAPAKSITFDIFDILDLDRFPMIAKLLNILRRA